MNQGLRKRIFEAIDGRILYWITEKGSNQHRIPSITNLCEMRHKIERMYPLADDKKDE